MANKNTELKTEPKVNLFVEEELTDEELLFVAGGDVSVQVNTPTLEEFSQTATDTVHSL